MPAARAPGTRVSPNASRVSASSAFSRRKGTPWARASRAVRKILAPPTVNASAPSAVPRIKSRRFSSCMMFSRRRRTTGLAALHRRHLPVQADVDARRGEAAVGLALRDREYLGAGLELAALGGREGHDHRAFGNQDLLLAALVLHREHAVLAHAGDIGHVGIGHLAGGPQVPVVVAFAGAAHGFRENVHFQPDQRAVALT